MQRARGNLEAALKPYQKDLAIAEKLAAQDPSNSEWQRDLIVSNVKLAEIAEAQNGQASEAKRFYGAALDIAMALRDAGRQSMPGMVEDLEPRLERVSQEAAP